MLRIFILIPLLYLLFISTDFNLIHAKRDMNITSILHEFEPNIDGKVAICILMLHLHEVKSTWRWIYELDSSNVTVFLLTDFEDFSSIHKIKDGLFHITINSHDCGINGFLDMGIRRGPNANDSVAAWDKANYFFYRVSPKYEKIWLIEVSITFF